MSEHPTRRVILHGVGIAGVVAGTTGALSACGGTTASGAASSAAGAAGSAASKAVDALAGAIKQAEIPVGGGKIIDKVVITQPTAGTFKAFSAVCTHKQCTVTKVENSKIECACHGSVFDAATGAVITGPATSPLPEKSVSVSADGIKVS